MWGSHASNPFLSGLNAVSDGAQFSFYKMIRFRECFCVCARARASVKVGLFPVSLSLHKLCKECVILTDVPLFSSSSIFSMSSGRLQYKAAFVIQVLRDIPYAHIWTMFLIYIKRWIPFLNKNALR